MTLIHISVFIISIAFALVSVYIAKILSRMSGMLGTLRQTIQAVEADVERTVVELEAVIVETDKTATDVETKLAAMDGLFVTVQNIGQTSAIVGESAHSRVKRFADEQSLPGTIPFIRAIQLGEFGHGLFRSWNRGKRASS